MRELSHTDPTAELPARRDEFPLTHVRRITDMRELPWMRRERVDANLRACVGELRALAVEDRLWSEQYLTLASAFESAISLIDAIEDYEDEAS